MEANILVTEIAQSVVNPAITVGFIITTLVAMVCFGCVVTAEANANIGIVLAHLVASIIMGALGWALYGKSSQLSYRVYGYDIRGIPVVAYVDTEPKLETWVDAYRVTRRFQLK